MIPQFEPGVEPLIEDRRAGIALSGHVELRFVDEDRDGDLLDLKRSYQPVGDALEVPKVGHLVDDGPVVDGDGDAPPALRRLRPALRRLGRALRSLGNERCARQHHGEGDDGPAHVNLREGARERQSSVSRRAGEQHQPCPSRAGFLVDTPFLEKNVTGTIRLLPGSTGSIVPTSRARYMRRSSLSMLSVSWSSGPSPLDGSAPVRRLIAIRTSARPAPSIAAAIVARRMRGSETATATTAATIPNPPRPSMRILAILISEGDGLSRRRGTTMVGVRGRLKARFKK